jgi:tetratricopeptide (TPR) repeat protein
VTKRYFYFVFLTLFICGPAKANETLSAIKENNEAVRRLEQEDTLGAEQQLLNALPESPFHPVLRLNLGLTYEIQKKYERAQREYEAVLRTPGLPDEISFNAHFNAGNAAAQNKNVDQALAHYQAALQFQPDSKEAKKNIELLMKQGAGKGKGQQGGGQGQDQSENKDQNQGQGQDPQQDQQPKDPKDDKKQKEFKSENLSKEDVRKIMEELKSQEKKIRALEYGTKGKEAPSDKDW